AAVLRHLELEASAARTAARIIQDGATPVDATRQVVLLTAIRSDDGLWKACPARKTLATLRYRVPKGTTGVDPSQLDRSGHLVRHGGPGVTYYSRTSTTGTR